MDFTVLTFRGNCYDQPILDKAEVAVEYPDKLYIGTFAHTARP